MTALSNLVNPFTRMQMALLTQIFIITDFQNRDTEINTKKAALDLFPWLG